MRINYLLKLKSIFSIYRGLPQAIYIVFICRLINAMGYFVFPFLTLFLSINLSLSADKVGIYLMLVEAGRISGALFGGRFTDLFGRKKSLIIFQLAIAIFLLPCAFLNHSFLIPKLLIAAAFFNGATRPVYDAIMVDLSYPQNRKEDFSFIYLGVNLGFGVGSLIAGFLYVQHVKYLFLGNVAAIFIVCIFISLYIGETLPEEIKKDNGSNNSANKESLLIQLLKKPAVLSFSLVSILFYLTHSQLSFSLPLQINELFGQNGPRNFGIIMSFNCFIVVFMTMPVTFISREFRPILNVTFSGILFAIGFGMLYWIVSFPWILISTFIWTIGEILIRTNAGVYIANHSPKTHRGRFNSLVIISGSIGRLIGPPMLGILIAGIEIRMVWIFVFFNSMIATGLMFKIYYSESR